MKTRLLGLIACMALLSVSQAGAETLVGTTTDATGIDGLVVDGVTYNVTFVNDSYNHVYASTPPTFLGNGSGASDAATALAAELNTLGVVGLAGASAPFDGYLNLDVPVSYDPVHDFNSSYATGCPSLTGGTCASSNTWITYTDNNELNDFVRGASDYAVFAATPLPGALPLFSSGLGALGLLGWRRKRKAAALAAIKNT